MCTGEFNIQFDYKLSEQKLQQTWRRRIGDTCTNWIANELLPTERKPMRATFRCFVWAILPFTLSFFGWFSFLSFGSSEIKKPIKPTNYLNNPWEKFCVALSEPSFPSLYLSLSWFTFVFQIACKWRDMFCWRKMLAFLGAS